MCQKILMYRPAKGAMAMATPCRFGANCVRQGCMFQHPQGYTPGPGMQKGSATSRGANLSTRRGDTLKIIKD